MLKLINQSPLLKVSYNVQLKICANLTC